MTVFYYKAGDWRSPLLENPTIAEAWLKENPHYGAELVSEQVIGSLSQRFMQESTVRTIWYS